MLRSTLKVVLFLTPFHIFLTAIWSFLLHPIILIIFCHQLALLHASAINPFFVTAEVRGVHHEAVGACPSSMDMSTAILYAKTLSQKHSNTTALPLRPLTLTSETQAATGFHYLFKGYVYKYAPLLSKRRTQSQSVMPTRAIPLIDPFPPPPKDPSVAATPTHALHTHLLGSPFYMAFYTVFLFCLLPNRRKHSIVGSCGEEKANPTLYVQGRAYRRIGLHQSWVGVVCMHIMCIPLVASNASSLPSPLTTHIHPDKGHSTPYTSFVHPPMTLPPSNQRHSVTALSVKRTTDFENTLQDIQESPTPPSRLYTSTVTRTQTQGTYRQRLNQKEKETQPSHPPNSFEKYHSALVSIHEGVQTSELLRSTPPAGSITTSRSRIKLFLSALPSLKQKDTQHLIEASFRIVSSLGRITLWYFSNCQFNIQNKKALMLLPLPFTVSFLQSAVGIPLALLPWILRTRPTPVLSPIGRRSIIEQSLWHTALHISAMSALSAGAVGFVSIIKASEPVMTAGLSALLLGKWLPIKAYLSLIPVIIGVLLASVKELTFAWNSFIGAMVSNIASTVRSLKAKQALSNTRKLGSFMSPQNIFALVHLVSVLMEAPFAFLEVPQWTTHWAYYLSKCEKAGVSPSLVFRHIWLSGLFYFLYNDLALSVLNGFSPVSHAVANTLKRVTVLVASTVVFGTKVPFLSVAGSAMAIVGTFLYTLSKAK